MNNPYSKYRFDNTFNPKFRVNFAKNTKLYGVEQRLFKDSINSQLPDVPSTWVNAGSTCIVNNVFKCTQITIADQPIVNDRGASSRWTFFKLFKL